MSTTRLILCRHAEPEDAAGGAFRGTSDVPLSEAGRAEATVLAETLAAERLAALYSSPARRALETAHAVGEATGLEPIHEPRLREIDFGAIEGLTFDEVAGSHPELHAEWLRSPTTVRFPGGECFADLRARVLEAASELIDRHDAQTVAVVSHAGAIRALLAAWLSIPDAAIFRVDQRYASVNVVDWMDGTPVVRLLNGPPASPVRV